MFNNVNDIIWGAYVSQFVDFLDEVEIITEEVKAPQNEQVKVIQSQEIFSKKKIFEDTDGEYVDFVEL